MKGRSLTLVGAFLLLLAAILALKGFEKEPQTKKTTPENKQVVPMTARPRTTPSAEKVVIVEYSTRAFLKQAE